MKFRSKIVPLMSSGVLFVVAGLAWFSYMAQGIAYGDLYGVRGREMDLAQLGAHAVKAFDIAVCSEALAVGIVSWVLIATTAPGWLRLSIGLTLAIVATFFTYVITRGL